jgi:ammonia channel protein AmtB
MFWKMVFKLLGNTEPVDGRAACWMAVLGFVAGGVKATMHRSEKTTRKDVVVAAVGSALVATLAGFALQYLWGRDRMLLIFPICGVAGWMGVALLDLFGDYAMRRLKAKFGGDDNAK